MPASDTTKRYYTLGSTVVAVRDSATTQLSYLLGDQLGSTTTAVNSSTGATQTQRFLPYGAPRSGSIAATDRGWIGQTKDSSTGLQYLNARYYDPVIGRFTATDLLADLSSPGTLDAYGYSSGSPVTLSDPTGLLNELGGGAYGHTTNMCRGYSLGACDRMSLFRPAKPSKPWSGPFGSPLRGAKNAVVGTARLAGGLVADVGGCATGNCDLQTTRAVQHGIADSVTHPSHVYRPCFHDPGACAGETAAAFLIGGATRRVLGRSGALVDDAAAVESAFTGKVMTLGSRAAAREALGGDVGVAANRFFSGATSKSEAFVIRETEAGGYQFEFFSPANNPGYGKQYVQRVDASGRIVREYKNTIGPEGVIETMEVPH
jgi:RHS repeat-associated protein